MQITGTRTKLSCQFAAAINCENTGLLPHGEDIPTISLKLLSEDAFIQTDSLKCKHTRIQHTCKYLRSRMTVNTDLYTEYSYVCLWLSKWEHRDKGHNDGKIVTQERGLLITNHNGIMRERLVHIEPAIWKAEAGKELERKDRLKAKAAVLCGFFGL